MKKYYRIMYLMVGMIILLMLIIVSNNNSSKDNKKIINLYTNVSFAQIEPLLVVYDKTYDIGFDVITVTKADWQEKIFSSTQKNADNIVANVLLLDVELLEEIAKQQTMLPLENINDQVIMPDEFKGANNKWIGVWYDPVVIVANADIGTKIRQGNIIWDELPLHDDWRVAMNDCLATDVYGNMLYYLSKAKGEKQTIEYFKLLHKNVVKYSQFLDAPTRMTGIGECDIAITIQSEALRYMYDGFPLYVLYPNDGTVFFLTAAAIVSEKEDSDKHGYGMAFINWLLTENMEKYMVKNKFYFVPTNSATSLAKKYKEYGIKLLPQSYLIDESYKSMLLKKWAKEVRFIDSP